jgi:hypothetical protein
MPRLSKIGAAALAAFGWTGLSSVTASYLVVAGGGGGGGIFATYGGGGGGGAGGYRTGTVSLNPTLSYTVTVGAGGSAGTSAPAKGGNGNDSVFSTITSTGGGGAGSGGVGTVTGNNGGSGGGAANDGTNPNAGGSGNTPSTSPSQGNNGGSTTSPYAPNYSGAGGGGASAVGANSTSTTGGNGGAGTASSITGSSVTYAGGGGGGTYNGGTVGTGGAGGGGNAGASGGNNNGNAGTANLGGGGGGGSASTGASNGGNGGAGVVIISYVGAQQFGGGVVTSSGGNTIHTFTTSGTLSPLNSLTASYLIVAGGGGGGGTESNYNGAGGGGAGGLLSGSGTTIDTNSIYAVTVGAGGAGGTISTIGVNGSNSSFSMVSTAAVGGGGGGTSATTVGNKTGANGGSGGGGAGDFPGPFSGGTGTSGQGNAGGAGFHGGSYGGGGGGGASAVGQSASAAAGNGGGNGGAGTASSISGSSVTYAGGGAGGMYATAGTGNPGTGGAGGGGNGGTRGGGNGFAGTANLGGGGGGATTTSGSNQVGGNGGAGVVIISYPGSTQQMAGGTVTVAGGNVIHTFTSSGYLTPIVLATNSLRFRSSASAQLTRTVPGVNTTQLTFSCWFKSSVNSTDNVLYSTQNNSSNYLYIGLNSSNALDVQIGATANRRITTQVFRDPAAWYHLVVVFDTTQATASNRIQIYVNGSQVTAFSTNTTGMAQNANLPSISSTLTNYIGGYNGSAGFYFDGYMAEINMVYGQALTPNSFGTFNGLGVWQPIRYGGSYGTNGFYLPFTGSTSYAASFNGSSQYLQTGNATNLSLGTGDFTIEGWFNRAGGSNNGIFQLSTTVGGFSTSTSNTLSVNFGANTTFGIYAAGNATNTTVPDIGTNNWNHFALVRSGTTTTAYLNGRFVVSVSDSTNYTGTYLVVGGYYSTSYTWNGSISNFRIVKGTALYTTGFNPSTTPLTAISGTQFLTLQNATIIDNSTNAYSITNNGSMVTTQSFPFTGSIAQDKSPAGNNWTTNNFGTQVTSNIDSMTDVPTLTSATTANYCVWSPINKSSTQNVTNGNLTASSSGGTSYGALCATMGVSSGKWYWEMIYTRNGSTNSPVIGFGNDLFNYTNPPGGYLGSDLNAGGINVFNGNAAINGTSTAYGSAIASNDVVMFAMDLDNRKFYVGKNGTWFNSGNPVSGTNSWPYSATIVGSTFFPAVNMFNDSAATNFGQQPWVYTPPTGFVALNTFNLPTPTIGATASTTANKYFDATLYTGTGSSNTIVNAGSFPPALVWLKRRSAAESHGWWDTVRGGSLRLESNTTGAESSTTDRFSGITSTGFTVTSTDPQTNASGSTYVGWQWRGSDSSAVTNTAGTITSTVSANTTAGFSVVTYTGTGSNATVGHGLGVAPSMVIVKMRSAGGNNWQVYHSALGQNKILQLDLTTSVDTITNYWYNGTTSTVFGVNGSYSGINSNGATYVAYCFAPVAGYSAFGSYTGNGSSDGPFIFTGFRPAMIWTKQSNTTGPWNVLDNKRGPYNVNQPYLQQNSSNAEASVDYVDFLSNGFKIRYNGASPNASGDTIIYIAFAENPFKYANAR